MWNWKLEQNSGIIGMMHTNMRFIGITGGVGAGKTEILKYLDRRQDTRVMLADEIAHDLMEPGTKCYEKLKSAFPSEDIYLENGQFDRGKLASVIFSDEAKRERLNAIVHPAVKEYVREQVAYEQERGVVKWLVLEAALLIEEHYDEICDELWYIYTSEDNRRARLKASRGYSDEKVDQIFNSQLEEKVYRQYCTVIIDNNGTVDKATAQIEKALRREADE